MTSPLNTLSAREASRLVSTRQINSEELVRCCVERAERRERDIHAWAHLAAESAIDQAKKRDMQQPVGPLHGVPVAVKDLFDVVKMPATYGSPIYASHYPAADAACVALLRAAGAIIMGKTTTVEFAASTPTATRNPLNLDHTPGGSSSGSAAVVADCQVPFALGTQTGGSVIRPAAFCGIVGFKPSFGRVCLAGCKMSAWSLDTLGFLTRNVEDSGLAFSVLANADTVSLPTLQIPPRVGVFVDPRRDKADSAARSAVENAATTLSFAGATLKTVKAPAEFEPLRNAQRVVARFEMARSLAYEWNSKREMLSETIKEELAEGWAYSQQDYFQAQDHARLARNFIDPLFEDIDILLTIATTGEAPYGLTTTGSAFFNSPWTMLGNPAICLPFGKGPAGLPIAIQLVGRTNQDERLLQAAAWVETCLVQQEETALQTRHAMQ